MIDISSLTSPGIVRLVALGGGAYLGYIWSGNKWWGGIAGFFVGGIAAPIIQDVLGMKPPGVTAVAAAERAKQLAYEPAGVATKAADPGIIQQPNGAEPSTSFAPWQPSGFAQYGQPGMPSDNGTIDVPGYEPKGAPSPNIGRYVFSGKS